MSLYPSTLQLSPSVCLHLLCLLLILTDSSSTAPTKVPAEAEPLTQLATTQGVTENAAVTETTSTKVTTSPQKNLSHKINVTVAPIVPLDQPASPSNQQSVPPETVTQPAALLPSTITGSPTPTAHPGSITSTGTITPTTILTTVRNVLTTPVLVTTTPPMSTTRTTTTTPPASTTTTTTTPTPTPTPASTTTPTTTSTSTTTTTTKTIPTSTATTAAAAAPHAATTVKATTTPVTVTTTAGVKMSPPPSLSSAATPQPDAPSTGMPPIQTTSLPTGPAPTTVTSTITPANSNEPVASGTRVAVVEAAGADLTRQLVDTASLLAVLLFGLLFFLVTVAVFVTQAYESYRRKDYTQVDYLINGMYTDSGV